MRERWSFLLISAALIGVGLLTRANIGLPPWFAKYAGSILWGAMIYFVLASVLPGWSWRQRAVVAVVVTAAVEFSQLLHTEWLDAFRRTAIGVLLLGRYFSFADIACYWVGIAASVAVERWMLGRRGINFR